MDSRENSGFEIRLTLKVPVPALAVEPLETRLNLCVSQSLSFARLRQRADKRLLFPLLWIRDCAGAGASRANAVLSPGPERHGDKGLVPQAAVGLRWLHPSAPSSRFHA